MSYMTPTDPPSRPFPLVLRKYTYGPSVWYQYCGMPVVRYRYTLCRDFAARLRNWTGVTVTNGRVTGLRLEKCSSSDGLDAIGSIEELESMSWCTRLAAVPEAVRRLNALEELYFVDPANDNTGAEEAEPTALPCFGSSSSGDTPSSPCPEPRSRNLRGRR